MKKYAEIIILLGITFVLFVSLVLVYEKKIDELENDIKKLEYKCITHQE